MTAAEVAAASGIPEGVIVEKFGLRGKHIAAPDEHVSDLAVAGRGAAARRDRRRPGARSTWSSTSARCGRTTRSGRPRRWIAHRLGCANAYAVEYDNVSYGAPVALRARARHARRGGRSCGAVLAVGASPRVVPARLRATSASRFMFNFGDGAVAALLVEDGGRERGARLARDHGRLALAAGEGAVGRQRRSPERHGTASSTSPTRRR